jgi:hypothetical protein
VVEESEQESLGLKRPDKDQKRKISGHGDRYTINDFDLVVTNPLNSIYMDVKYTQVNPSPKLMQILYTHYNVSSR